MLRGLPASGKSSWAKMYVEERLIDYGEKWKIINKDQLRLMLDNGKWSRENEKYIITARDMLILSALKADFNVIVDDTNFAPIHETNIKAYCQTLLEKENIDVKIRIKDFSDVSVDECIRRDVNRANSVGTETIRRMYNQYLKPQTTPLEYIEGLPKAIICDIDGTLALFKDSPYDRDFSKDILDDKVSHIVNTYHNMGFKIIIVSGRKNKYLEITTKWLNDNKVAFEEIHMPRSEKDWRKDYILKEEVYNKHIKDKYNVFFVLDDRSQVVRLWRELGIKTLQVADGDF